MSDKELSAENGIERPESNNSEPWRYVCPRGHTSWKNRVSQKDRYYCEACGSHFCQLVDLKDERPDPVAEMGVSR